MLKLALLCYLADTSECSVRWTYSEFYMLTATITKSSVQPLEECLRLCHGECVSVDYNYNTQECWQYSVRQSDSHPLVYANGILHFEWYCKGNTCSHCQIQLVEAALKHILARNQVISWTCCKISPHACQGSFS